MNEHNLYPVPENDHAQPLDVLLAAASSSAVTSECLLLIVQFCIRLEMQSFPSKVGGEHE